MMLGVAMQILLFPSLTQLVILHIMIIHIAGIFNVIADAISRKQHQASTVSPSFNLLLKIITDQNLSLNDNNNILIQLYSTNL